MANAWAHDMNGHVRQKGFLQKNFHKKKITEPFVASNKRKEGRRKEKFVSGTKCVQ